MGILRRLLHRLSPGDEKKSPSPSPPSTAPTPAKPLAPVQAEENLKAEALSTLHCGARELKERLEAGEPVTVVDVRSVEEVRGGKIPGALHIPLPELEARWRELEKIDEIVCYCAVGKRSLQAARLLREKGLFNATSLEGGIQAWKLIHGDVTKG